jgi:hypothetical protein
MIRGLPRFAAQADEPVNRDGEPGEGGTGTVYCPPSVPPEDDASRVFCTATPGRPGAPGKAVQN